MSNIGRARKALVARILEGRRRRDNDPIPIAGNEPEDGYGGDEGLAGGVTRLDSDPRPAGDRAQDVLLERPRGLGAGGRGRT
jgi:hypothetical protein